ncbi:MAG: hypothetical protein K940chlam3_01473 [Chlamydiae bacterium]|nr:hypothetical protein [Chlamydiota bacterium]
MRMTYEGDLRVTGDFTTDVSQQWGGLGKYPSPTDMMAASLGSCILSIMAMKAKAMGFDFTGTDVEVEKMMNAQGRFVKFIVTVDCTRAIDQRTAEKLERAAYGCPVHAAIHPNVDQEIIFKWNLTG